MKIVASKSFIKSYKTRIKPYSKLDLLYEQRLFLFESDSSNPVLKDHKLLGKKRSFRSFSISGDIRVIYSREKDGSVLLIDIGTHNQVYS